MAFQCKWCSGGTGGTGGYPKRENRERERENEEKQSLFRFSITAATVLGWDYFNFKGGVKINIIGTTFEF
jgi:hypothetical protein